ncbi:MAG: TonB-dependent receptor plug domain-containing protein [Selenomonas noxia]|uniref:TonB-dependent receptor plug domain-containing protein n=1 Tax=Selenomonas noxia TaxID=135083 RepID=UPI001CB510C7|nr:TonB-dependent receptor [Selenomonas noxia]MBF1662657.1 TonB-dependent receptor [Selenomonas noxia]
MTMKMWNKKFLAAAVVLSAMTGQVYAAETAHTGTGDDETLPTYLHGEVVVTATRTRKKDIDVPAATTVITAEDIKQSGAANVSDVLSKVDGFVYKSFGPNGAAMGAMTNEVNVRGLKGGALVLMNGNPIAWRGKYNLDQIPASQIERIEIVKGGGSVLYGSEAVAGVINIITKKKSTNEVHAGFGNYGQRSYGVTLGDDKFGFYYNYDKFGRRDKLTYTDYEQARLHAQTRTDIYDIVKQNMGVTYRVNPRLDFQVGYYETEGKYSRTITAVDNTHGPTAAQHIRIGEPYNRRKYETKQYITQLNYRDSKWKGSLFFNTGTLEFKGPSYFNSRTGLRTPNGRYHTREKNMTYGIDMQRTWRVNPKSTAILGVDLMHERFADIPTDASTDNARYSRNNWGVFGQWEQRFDERNTGIFGLRETWTTGAARGQNYHNLSASAQWLHKLNRENSVYLNVSQSFVMPTFAQMYPNNDRQMAAPDLRPQKGVNYEIGWKQKHNGHSWKAALFHMRVKDNITARVNRIGGRAEYQYTNEDFRNIGLELSNEIQGTHGFSYNWGLTWQNPQTKSSKKMLGWERTFGRIQLTGGVTYKKDKWTSSLSASYLADRVQSPSDAPAYRSKPYLLTTWNTTYAPDENSELSLRIDNVLNRNDTTMHSGSEYYVAPINYLLSYSYRF